MRGLERVDWVPEETGGGPLLSRLPGQPPPHRRGARRRAGADPAAARGPGGRPTSASRGPRRSWLSSERLAMVGRLAAGVAHEVGNPLSGVLGWLSVAQARSASDAELSGYLLELEAEVRRIDGIVRGLLDLGRPARPQLGPVPVAELVRNATRLVGAGPEFRDVTVETRSTRGGGPRGSRALCQVLINLLINAAQAIGGPGTIKVTGGADAGGCASRSWTPVQGSRSSCATHLRAVLHHQVGREGHRARTRGEPAPDAGDVGRHRRGGVPARRRKIYRQLAGRLRREPRLARALRRGRMPRHPDVHPPLGPRRRRRGLDPPRPHAGAAEQGYEVRAVADGEEALRELAARDYDVGDLRRAHAEGATGSRCCARRCAPAAGPHLRGDERLRLARTRRWRRWRRARTTTSRSRSSRRRSSSSCARPRSASGWCARTAGCKAQLRAAPGPLERILGAERGRCRQVRKQIRKVAPVVDHRAHHRRERHRQGAGRPRAARAEPRARRCPSCR